MSTERHHVRCRGPVPPAMLVSQLREAGVEVDWTPPREQRSLQSLVHVLGDAAASHAVEMVAIGAGWTIKKVIDHFRNRHPDAEIDWREEDGYL